METYSQLLLFECIILLERCRKQIGTKAFFCIEIIKIEILLVGDWFCGKVFHPIRFFLLNSAIFVEAGWLAGFEKTFDH